MPYLGNTAGNRFVASKSASVYSGDGSTTAFTLEHAVGSDEDILVSVDGVVQEPSVAYAVSGGTTLTFTSAPSNNAGNNIFVYYLFRTVATVDHPSTSSLLATDGTFSGGITGTTGTFSGGITGTTGTFSGDLTVDTSTLYVDSTNNNIGIGTTSPTAFANYTTVAINGTTGSVIDLQHGGTINSRLVGESAGLLIDGVGSRFIKFHTNSTERMRIDDGGHILFGTTSLPTTGGGAGFDPDNNGRMVLHLGSNSTDQKDLITLKDSNGVVGAIQTVGGAIAIDVNELRINHGAGSSDTTTFRITGGTSGVSQLQLADTSDGNVGMLEYNHSSNYLMFQVNNAERMRIDASGNLLVGKTSSDTGATAGFEWYDAGNALFITRSGNPTLEANRLSSDGAIANFRKDGTIVGSIGTSGGDAYIAGTTHGLKFDSIDASTMYIRPVNNSGTNVTGQIDLGQAGNVFRDAYVSGGVYFAPNAYPANYLDDYEEGTWTPNLEFGGGSTGMGYNLQTGSYTKIGRLVNLHIAISLSSKGTSTGNATIANMPFTIADAVGGGTSLEASGAVGLFNGVNSVYGNLSVVAQNTSNEILIYRKSSATNPLNVQMTHGEINSNFEFRATITYQTT